MTDATDPADDTGAFQPALTPRARWIALGVLVVAACALGTAAIFVRLGEDAGVDPTAIAFWRLAFALPPLALWAAFDPQPNAPRAEPEASGGGRLWLFLALAAFFFAGDLVFWHAGIVRTTAANATLLANMTPVVMAFAAWFLFRERPTPLFVAGLAAAILGAVMLSGANLSIAPERVTGDALSIVTAFWYASYMLAVKAARARMTTGRVMFLSTLGSVPIVAAAVFVLGANDRFIPVDPVGWVWLVGLGLVPHAIGQGGLAYGLGRLPAALSALVVLIQPIVAAILGWILFGEALVEIQLAGGALIVAGIVIAQAASRRAEAQGRA